jgi:hypothetical protein
LENSTLCPADVPTVIPSGHDLYEVVSGNFARGSVEINLDEVSAWILSQTRATFVGGYKEAVVTAWQPPEQGSA